MARTVLSIVTAVILILVLGVPLLIYAVPSGNTLPLYRAGLFGARVVLWISGVKLDVRGREKIPPGRAVVYMPNHQSNCDPVAIFVVLSPVLILAKKEFFRIPILGQAMKLHGFIPVDRKNRESAIKAVAEATLLLKAGHSFLAFPEGTRSRDGRLQSFKKGVFLMAMDAGVPIVPISISGAREIMPKGAWAVRPGTVRITFQDAVVTEARLPAERERVIAEVRRAICRDLRSDEQPIEEPASEVHRSSR